MSPSMVNGCLRYSCPLCLDGSPDTMENLPGYLKGTCHGSHSVLDVHSTICALCGVPIHRGVSVRLCTCRHERTRRLILKVRPKLSVRVQTANDKVVHEGPKRRHSHARAALVLQKQPLDACVVPWVLPVFMPLSTYPTARSARSILFRHHIYSSPRLSFFRIGGVREQQLELDAEKDLLLWAVALWLPQYSSLRSCWC